MFAARCVGVSLAFFFLLYTGLSLATLRGWKLVWRIWSSPSARGSADLLFFLRIFPLLSSLAVTLLFTVPSFLLLEPRSSNEAVGTAPVILAGCCLVVLGVGTIRAWDARLKSSRMMQRWLRHSTLLDASHSAPVFQVDRSQPSFTVSGFCVPKVFVSESAVAALSASELRAALRHEMGHVRRFDNLKKMVFGIAAFPGLKALEKAWSEQTEMAADDYAVSSRIDAFDLAGALIKVSRLPSAPLSPALSHNLLHSSTALSQRVQRLVNWTEPLQSRDAVRLYVIPGIASAALIGLFACYSSLLLEVHAATEWLVR